PCLPCSVRLCFFCFFFFQAEDGIRDFHVTGVQTCALPIYREGAGDRLLQHPLEGGRVHGLVVPLLTQPPEQGRVPGGVEGVGGRSEERRVGKEGRWGGAPCQ